MDVSIVVKGRSGKTYQLFSSGNFPTEMNLENYLFESMCILFEWSSNPVLDVVVVKTTLG